MGGLRLVAHTSGQFPQLSEATSRTARPQSEDHGGRDRQLENGRLLPVPYANVHERRLQPGRHCRIARVNMFFSFYRLYGITYKHNTFQEG